MGSVPLSMESNMTKTLEVGARCVVTKGNKAFAVAKNVTVTILDVQELGADYSHQVRVRFRTLNGMGAGKVYAFYARHINRLSDPVVNLNSGNPLHAIQLRVV